MAGEFVVLNPGRRHRRRKNSRRRRRTNARRPHRRRRRNPFLMNPAPRRRRRRSGVRRRRHHVARRRGRKSRSGLAGTGPKFFGLDIGAAALVAAGAIGSELAATGVANAAPFVPQALKEGPGRLVLKAGVGLGAGMLLGRFLGPRVRNLVVLGVGVGVLSDVIRTYVLPAIPGLSDFDELSGYGPATSTLALGDPGDDMDMGAGFDGVIEERASFDED